MYIYPTVTINGVSSTTIRGLLITALAPISKPAQRALVDVIDGRAGDVITPLGFAAYDKPVTIALTKGYDIDEVIKFFNSSGVVTFSNEPDKYYNFAIYEQIDFERLIRFKTATVIFHVQPYKYANNENPLNFAITSGEPVSVTNNGNTDSKPDLIITGEGVVNLDINGEQVLNIDFGEDEQAYIIDSEQMNAYATENAIKDVKTDFLAYQASGTPTPDAPIPIVGVDKVNVTRTGKNLLGGSKLLANAQAYLTGGTTDTENKTFSFSSTASTTSGLSFTSGINFKSNTAYTLILTAKKSSGTGTNIRFQYTDGTSDNLGDISGTDKQTKVYTSNASKTLKSIIKYTSSGTTTLYYDETGVFEGTLTAQDFEPYNGQTATVNFGQTVYGGTINLTTGVLRITKGFHTVSSSRELSRISGSVYRVNKSNFPDGLFPSSASANGVICEKFKSQFTTMASGSCYMDNNGLTIRPVNSYESANAFFEDVGEFSFVYPLATPIVIYASNTAEIPTILGVNNIFSDAGELEVSYKAGGVIHTETGEIVIFTLTPEDYERGAFVNRQIVGNYDNIKLKSGANSISLTGNATSLTVDKYSRWI